MKARSAAVALAVLVIPLLVQAQVLPAGTEFQVNTYTSADQDEPAICRAADGNFVVVWQSGAYHDGDDYGIFAQRYASNGDELGTEFQVNSYTTYNQNEPAVCCDEAGNFVVVWESYSQDGFSDGVFGQRFTSDGSFTGTEFQVNTSTFDYEGSPAICCDTDGDFAVVWDGRFDGGGYGGVFGQRFASGGAFRGTEFQVNTHTTDYQEDPEVCCDAVGNFVVVWESYAQDGDYDGVFGQRFASNGAFRGTEFQVNTYTTFRQDEPDVCCDVAGNFVVVWENFGEQDGDETGVFGQRFASNGAPRGAEFQVNAYTSGEQDSPSICCDANGDFVVAWESEYADGSDEGVIARRFSHTGFASSEFQVNMYTSSDQDSPAVACDFKGNFVIVWDGDNRDGSHAGVFGQRFELLAIVPTPVLSFAGLVVAVIALLGAGATTLRRRRKNT